MASRAGQLGRENITRHSTLVQEKIEPTRFETRQAIDASLARSDAARLPLAERPDNDAIGQAPAYAKLELPTGQACGWHATSLFSGCGGLDLGFLQQGIFPVSAYDIDRKSLATYVQNLPGRAFRTDLSRLKPHNSMPTILLAGAPCQGFSTAGKRNVADPRNALLMRVADIAVASRPRVVIVENVPAALSGAHLRLWEGLEDRLRSAGYNVRRLLLDGQACGLGQRRKRLFLLSWLGSDSIRIEIPRQQSLSVREALTDLTQDEDIEWPREGTRDWLIAQQIGAGQRVSNVRISERTIATWDIPEVYGATTELQKLILVSITRLRRRERVRRHGDGDPVHINRLVSEFGNAIIQELPLLESAGYIRISGDFLELRQTYNGRYRRLEWDAPSPTVDTRFGRPDLFLHPSDNRGMTPREAARIQGFPDSFRFAGSKSDTFTQIGNAVPPPMAAILANFVREAILKA